MNFKSNKVTSAIVNGTKVSAKATAKAAVVTGSAIKVGTLRVTDPIEQVSSDAKIGFNNHVWVPVTQAAAKHNTARVERVLERKIARSDRKAEKAARESVVEANDTDITRIKVESTKKANS